MKMIDSGQNDHDAIGGKSEYERVLGGLEVEALLSIGSEHLFLLFTQTRIIMAHHAKTGRTSVPLYGLFGKMSEGMRRAPGKRGILEKMAEMDPAGILNLHRENFSIEYPRVVSMTIELSERGRAKITLVTTDQKFELYASPIAIEGVRESVISVLHEKAKYRG